MTKLLVEKKDGQKVPFDINKIHEAVKKASDRAGIEAPNKEQLEDIIYDYLSDGFIKSNLISTKDLHKVIINCLRIIDYKQVAESYQEYRNYKETYANQWTELKQSADEVLYLGDKENANFDSSLASTKRSLISGATTKALYKQFYLSTVEKELINRGDIYIHDLRDMLMNTVNCCLFDMGNVLKGGFEMSNVRYNEPNSVLAALQVMGDITLVATAQQYGGFTIPSIDTTLLPYCLKTIENAKDFAEDYTCTRKLEAYAHEVLVRELEQGFQSLELKLNTVPCSRGDFAFTTLTFGQWDKDYTDYEKKILRLICEVILNVRKKGHNGRQVVFPKLVYLYDENQVTNCPHSNATFDSAIECSATCMYPDYLSLSAEQGTVSRLFRENHVITHPMGCRAYLTPWRDPETDLYVTVGRSNIGAVSLNLPVIMAVCKKTYGDDWRQYFYKELDERLEVIREFFKKRYINIRHTKACTNPMAFTQGGFYKGTRGPDEEIGDLVDYMTASFGITALHEATLLYTGKSLKEDNHKFATEVVKHIKDKVDVYKKEDGHIYALYATPAESLCFTQAKQYKDYTGESLGEYFTNSFHLHVSEDVTPFEKQDHEEQLFHMIEGGHIQYVRIDNPENRKALKSVVERGMHKGFYQGVNFDHAHCGDCGKDSYNVMWKCPHCGSENLTVISRVCGYLGYSNVNGQSRMNDGKMCEISDRVSM